MLFRSDAPNSDRELLTHNGRVFRDREDGKMEEAGAYRLLSIFPCTKHRSGRENHRSSEHESDIRLPGSQVTSDLPMIVDSV